MKKTALVLSDASSTHTWTWIKGYNYLGFKVYLLSFEEPIYSNIPLEDFIKINSKFKPSIKRYLFGLSKVKSYIQKISPDIIFAHFIPNYGLLSYLQGQKPFVLFCWGTDLIKVSFKSIFHKIISKRIFNAARLIVVDAKFMKEIIEAKFKIESKKIIILPFGIEKNIRDKGANVKKENEKIILFTNRKLEKIYNPFIIIDGLSKVNFENYKLIWIAKGSLEKKVKEMVYQKGIFDKVEFFGFQERENLYKLLIKSDIYLSSSLYDGTSVSLLEAMNFGVFPIVSDILGNREWILDGVNGFLFDPLNSDELSFKIQEAIKNKILRERAIEINRKIIETKANWEENLKRFYEKIKDI
ncbi:MAG: glycosyltransferase family 4 protein [Candidatus Hydrothermales bacterium]